MNFPTTSGALAQVLKADLRGSPDIVVSELSTLANAGLESLSFIRDVTYAAYWASSKAAVAIVSAAAAKAEGFEGTLAGRAILVVPDADMALITLLEALDSKPAAPASGVHPTAIVDASARVDSSASVGPGCVIGARATIGAGALLAARVSVAEDCIVGERCDLKPNVVLYPRTVLGKGVVLHAGVVIGADGFGYRPSRSGMIKIPHIGNVVIGDDVEIGANSCVDRAKFGSTRIGSGTKIDNLTQIGHGVQVGRSVAICAQVGLSGSVIIGDGVMLAGQVGIPDGITVGAGAVIGGQSAPIEDVPPGTRAFGSPALPGRLLFAQHAFLSKLYMQRSAIYKLLEERGSQSPPS